jgi:hypothetical protein
MCNELYKTRSIFRVFFSTGKIDRLGVSSLYNLVLHTATAAHSQVFMNPPGIIAALTMSLEFIKIGLTPAYPPPDFGLRFDSTQLLAWVCKIEPHIVNDNVTSI